jgi:hypothetical protein
MNRRTFVLTSTAAFGALYLTGCNTTTVAEFVTLIGDDAAALASYFGQTTLAANLKSWASQIAIDVTNWQSGNTVQLAEQVIKDIQQFMGLIGTIPVVGPYVPLVDLLLSALSGLLLLLPQATGASVPHVVNGHVVLPIHYADASSKTMTAAKKNFTTQWNTLTTVAPLDAQYLNSGGTKAVHP